MYLSYYFNLPSGPAIVLVAFALFLLAFLFSPTQGILTHPRAIAGQSTLWRELKSLLPRR
jgi:manganese/iron transport system permease protein